MRLNQYWLAALFAVPASGRSGLLCAGSRSAVVPVIVAAGREAQCPNDQCLCQQQLCSAQTEPPKACVEQASHTPQALDDQSIGVGMIPNPPQKDRRGGPLRGISTATFAHEQEGRLARFRGFQEPGRLRQLRRHKGQEPALGIAERRYESRTRFARLSR